MEEEVTGGDSLVGMVPLVVAVAVVAAGIGVAKAVQWVVAPVVAAQQLDTVLVCAEDAVFFPSIHSAETRRFPSLMEELPEEEQTSLSVVVPAFNEQERMPSMLDDTIAFLQGRQQRDPTFSWEIIVVDDGSVDRTSAVARQIAETLGSDRMRVLTLKRNQGKARAIQRGMLCARGKLLLFADADGASQISDLLMLEARLKEVVNDQGHGVAVGSRAHLAQKARVERAWHRNLLMNGFHLLVYLFAVKSVKDTQCGFKLFTRRSAQWLFSNQRIVGWAFDAELLHNAESLKIPIAEVAIHWHEVPGSKLSLLSASLSMARDLIVLWAAYSCGLWNIQAPFIRKKAH